MMQRRTAGGEWNSKLFTKFRDRGISESIRVIGFTVEEISMS